MITKEKIIAIFKDNHTTITHGDWETSHGVFEDYYDRVADEILALVPKKSKAKKDFIPPTIEEFIAYFKENGFGKELAERAYKGYEVAEWRDSKGQQIKSWKQKCQHVWFSDRNKDYKIDDSPQNEFGFL